MSKIRSFKVISRESTFSYKGSAIDVRQVASEEGTVLVDLAEAFDRLPRVEQERYFVRDGIHLNTFGNRKAAEIMLDVFRGHGLVERIAENERERFAR